MPPELAAPMLNTERELKVNQIGNEFTLVCLATVKNK